MSTTTAVLGTATVRREPFSAAHRIGVTSQGFHRSHRSALPVGRRTVEGLVSWMVMEVRATGVLKIGRTPAIDRIIVIT